MQFAIFIPFNSSVTENFSKWDKNSFQNTIIPHKDTSGGEKKEEAKGIWIERVILQSQDKCETILNTPVDKNWIQMIRFDDI